jgi:hypothetical protein
MLVPVDVIRFVFWTMEFKRVSQKCILSLVDGSGVYKFKIPMGEIGISVVSQIHEPRRARSYTKET